MNFNKIIMISGAVIMLVAGTYSVSNIYYFGPKKYKETIEKPKVIKQEIEDCGNNIYPKSLIGAYISGIGMLIYTIGLYKNKKINVK